MTTPAVEFIRADRTAAPVFAALSEMAFEGHAGRRWTATDFDEILSDPNVIGVLVRIAGDPLPENPPVGFAILRRAADEAELLLVAVVQAWRGHGIGRAIMVEAGALAAEGGARQIFLEVAQDNRIAIRFYRGLGFTEVGRRPNYYPRAVGESAVAAVVMSANLPF